MKVFELSRELNIPNKELIEIIQGLGIDVQYHLSIISEEDANKVRNALPKSEKKAVKTKSAPKSETWKPDLKRMICIENISRGKLIYISKRQLGYTVEWPNSGDTNYLELGEFINLKNTDRRFVTEPWVRIREDDEIEILKYANVYKYYEHIIEINDTKDILLANFQTFKKKFDKLPEGYKSTVAEHAAKMVKTGELDSIKIKDYIEESMGIELDLLVR